MTIDSILEEMRAKVANNEPMPPSYYLDRAAQLNLLVLDLDEEIVKGEMVVAREMARLMTEGSTAAHAKIMVKAMPENESLLLLKSRKEHIMELVRIAKKRTELARWDQG